MDIGFRGGFDVYAEATRGMKDGVQGVGGRPPVMIVLAVNDQDRLFGCTGLQWVNRPLSVNLRRRRRGVSWMPKVGWIEVLPQHLFLFVLNRRERRSSEFDTSQLVLLRCLTPAFSITGI
ncbi:MAG: hypothetical protein M2R45_04610 [Verrucomicrobia subdivision 3 bacterium]|nr:hypothetical protein [Limisphaerales bacterium]MCS1417327.1 hypothetical protein [Limisphaerales bacterium]